MNHVHLFAGLALVALLAGCVAPAAVAPRAPVTRPAHVASLPAEYANAVSFARTMGPLIYRHWRAVHVAAGLLQRTPTAHGDGWVTEQTDSTGTVRVSFIAAAGTVQSNSRWQPHSLSPLWVSAAVRVPDEVSGRAPELIATAAPRTLTAFEHAKLRARITALAAETGSCAGARDAVVISWRRDGADVFYAYVLAAAQDTGAPQVGADREMILDGEGARVLASRLLAAQCLPVGRDSDAALSLSTSLRAAPEPIDVFHALRFARPLHLHTTMNGLTWLLEGDRVTLLDAASHDSTAAHGSLPGAAR